MKSSPRPQSHFPRATAARTLQWLLAIAALIVCGEDLALSDDSVDARRACEHEHAIRIGNPGKDVIWVPTHDKLVTAMLLAAGTGPNDFVIDLGAGDGKIPIAAAKEFGATALGIEYDSKMVELAQCYVRAERLSDSVEIRRADIFQEDFSKATVLTMYLLPELNKKLRPSLLGLRPGTRIISNRFKMGRWQPDELISVEGVANEAYLWIVPAPIEGVWRFQQQSGAESFRARLQQDFQIVRGKILSRSERSIRGKVRGTQIELLVPLRRSRHFKGQLENDQITLRSNDSEAPDVFIGRRD